MKLKERNFLIFMIAIRYLALLAFLSVALPVCAQQTTIKNLKVTNTLKITAGTPGAGKLLQSDATGNATWQTFSDSSLWSISDTSIFPKSFLTRNVGIGTDTPNTKLNVHGDFIVYDVIAADDMLLFVKNNIIPGISGAGIFAADTGDGAINIMGKITSSIPGFNGNVLGNITNITLSAFIANTAYKNKIQTVVPSTNDTLGITNDTSGVFINTKTKIFNVTAGTGTLTSTLQMQNGSFILSNRDDNDSLFLVSNDSTFRFNIRHGSANQLIEFDNTGAYIGLTVGNFEINTTTGAFIPPLQNVTQAGALSPSDGMIIYVTDTDGTFTSVGFWGRENGAWVKL
jgi:hypothetical protein